MMKSCGIIAEYNPFHNGHLYQIQEAKKLTSADVMIVVMSGNFLQRGEPALVDKWKRAEMALASGADLVIELPLAFSIQPADYFAKGGITLLHELHCDALSFGTESGTGQDFQLYADELMRHEKDIEAKFHQLRNNGETYASQMQHVLGEIMTDSPLQLNAPNTILGLAYAKKNSLYRHPMELYPIRRIGAGYHDQTLGDAPFQSATALRKEVLKKDPDYESIRSAVPLVTLDILQHTEFIQWELFWPLLKYQLIIQPVEELRKIYQMNEGIEYRLKQKVAEAETFEQFVELVKTKRYPWVRLQRLLTYVLLQCKNDSMQEALKKPNAIRVLGFSEKGQQYLNEIKKEVSLPIISRVNKKNQFLWDMDIQAGRIYQLATTKNNVDQDFNRTPIRKKAD